MRRILIPLVFLLFITPFVIGEMEQKVVQVGINMSVDYEEVDNLSRFYVRLFNNQNSYDWTLNEGVDESRVFDFFSIAQIECETKDIENLTKELVEFCKSEINDCYDDDGIIYKWKYTSLRENYQKLDSECYDIQLNITESNSKYDECMDSLEERSEDFYECKESLDENEQSDDKHLWWGFFGLVIGGVGCYVLMTKKIIPSTGPNRDFPQSSQNQSLQSKPRS